MNEISDLLQPLVDLAPPGPSIEELTQRVKAHRRRRKLGVFGGIAVLIAAAALAVALLVPASSRAKVEVVGVPQTISGAGSGQGQPSTPPSLQSGLKLAFTTSPSGGPSGSPWTTQPAVTIEDSGGNPANSTVAIRLAIASGPAGATLTCTGGTSMAAVDRAATFSGCQIVGPIGNYTLTATDVSAARVGPAITTSFAITVGSPTQLVFTTPPVGGPSGTPFATQPVVTIEDSGGNTVTTATDTITLAITAGAHSAVLTCNGLPPSVAAAGGVAAFSGCQITGPANFYTITASDPPLASAMSPVLITLSASAAH